MIAHWKRFLGGGYSTVGYVLSQVGWGFEQADLVEDIPAYGRGLDK